jgi:two-component system chemotaxis response regulator CheY
LSTILVVDDDADTRFMFRLILEPAGHVVVEAGDGEAAMEFISPNALPDVITTDLAMPILNGEGLITRLRAQASTASIPIVVVTADPEGARALERSGLVEAIVIKPFDPFALEACIRALAGASTRAAGSARGHV